MRVESVRLASAGARITFDITSIEIDEMIEALGTSGNEALSDFAYELIIGIVSKLKLKEDGNGGNQSTSRLQ